MLNNSDRSNSVSRSSRSALRERADNPNSLMTMTFSLLELGVVSAALASCVVSDETPGTYYLLIRSRISWDRLAGIEVIRVKKTVS